MASRPKTRPGAETGAAKRAPGDKKDAPTVCPAVVDGKGLGALLGCCRSTIQNRHIEGRLPDPLPIFDEEDRRVWGREEILAWIRDGCPSREEWRKRWRELRKHA